MLTRPSTKFWQTMFKKGPTSSALSSTTAHGYLPPYSGYAAKSLSPSVSKNPVSPIRETSPDKLPSEVNEAGDGGVLLTPAPDKHRENRPPHPVSSLEDQFRNIGVDSSERHDLAATLKL